MKRALLVLSLFFITLSSFTEVKFKNFGMDYKTVDDVYSAMAKWMNSNKNYKVISVVVGMAGCVIFYDDGK